MTTNEILAEIESLEKGLHKRKPSSGFGAGLVFILFLLLLCLLV